MWDRDLVARLSPKGSQVLLSLLLSRSLEVQQSSAEFATLTGLGQRSIAPALLELKRAGLIQIIAQPGKPPLVRLVHPEEVRSETVVAEVSHEDIGPHLGSGGRPALAPVPEDTPTLDAGEGGRGAGREEGQGGDVDGEGTSEVQAGVQGHAVSEGMEHLALPNRQTAYKVPASAPVDSEKVLNDDEEIEQGLLNNCQLADQHQDTLQRVVSIQAVWNYAFPESDYPYQRLTKDAAQRLLVNRTAEWVGGVILDAVKTARSKIVSPRAYIEKIVASAEAKTTKQEPIINDDLRNLTRLGREQFHAQSEDGG